MTVKFQPDRLLVTAKEAAKMLSISARSLWTMTNMGTIPSIRIGRSVRYSVEDLLAFIEKARS
jgi:excisionase family DNA binding protein